MDTKWQPWSNLIIIIIMSEQLVGFVNHNYVYGSNIRAHWLTKCCPCWNARKKRDTISTTKNTQKPPIIIICIVVSDNDDDIFTKMQMRSQFVCFDDTAYPCFLCKIFNWAILCKKMKFRIFVGIMAWLVYGHEEKYYPINPYELCEAMHKIFVRRAGE